MRSVPHTKGTTPNDRGSRRGAHLVPKRKSKAGICLKNIPASLIKTQTIAKVVNTDKEAQRNKLNLIISSRHFPELPCPKILFLSKVVLIKLFFNKRDSLYQLSLSETLVTFDSDDFFPTSMVLHFLN